MANRRVSRFPEKQDFYPPARGLVRQWPRQWAAGRLPAAFNSSPTGRRAGKRGLLFVYFLFAVLAIPLWTRLSKAFGKHRVWCCSMMSASLVFTFVPVLGPGDLPAFGVVCALTGATLGGDLTLPPAIQADAADWDRLKFRQDRTATLFSYWSMATKLAIGAGVGIAFPTLGYFGLDNQTQDPTSTRSRRPGGDLCRRSHRIENDFRRDDVDLSHRRTETSHHQASLGSSCMKQRLFTLYFHPSGSFRV